MLQLVYISTVCGKADVDAILRVSRRNNARDDVTGLLYHDGRRFLQALEGDETSVEATFARIAADPGHRAIVTLSRRIVEVREFGPWQMAACTAPDEREWMLHQVAPLLANVSANVRGTFEGFMKLDRAA